MPQDRFAQLDRMANEFFESEDEATRDTTAAIITEILVHLARKLMGSRLRRRYDSLEVANSVLGDLIKRRPPSFDESSAGVAYLFRCVNSKLAQYARRGRREPDVTGNGSADAEATDTMVPIDPRSGRVDELLERVELRFGMERLKNILSESDYQLLWRWARGVSARTIAMEDGVSADTAKQRVHRAKERAKEFLQRAVEGQEGTIHADPA